MFSSFMTGNYDGSALMEFKSSIGIAEVDSCIFSNTFKLDQFCKDYNIYTAIDSCSGQRSKQLLSIEKYLEIVIQKQLESVPPYFLNYSTAYPERLGESESYCSQLETLDVFKLCHEFVSPVFFEENCKHDYCGCISTSDVHCYCSAMSAYELECAKHGVELTWRNTVAACALDCPEG